MRRNKIKNGETYALVRQGGARDRPRSSSSTISRNWRSSSEGRTPRTWRLC